MKIWLSHQSHLQRSEKVDSGVGTLRIMTFGGIVVLLSCLWVFGCSSPPESVPGPSKEEIRSDADRFFEKMENEEQGKPASKP